MVRRTHCLSALAWLGIFLVSWVVPSSVVVAQPADPGRPLLVTVDDLPMLGLHREASAARRLEITEGLLQVLEAHDIQAVGLVTWGLVGPESDTQLLEKWLQAGHELGNHSYDHRSLHRGDSETFIADVEKARHHLVPFLESHGKDLRFFRFPLLHEGDTHEKLMRLRQYLDTSGQRNLPVSLDNADWEFEAPWVAARAKGDTAALARLGDEFQQSLRLSIRHHEKTGDALFDRPVPQILLLHATAIGVSQWDALFTWLKQRGYRFASADEVLADPAFSEPHEHVGARGFGLWDRLVVERNKSTACQEVATRVHTQAKDWNRGDLVAFTDIYDTQAAFLSTTGLTHGRQQVLERYQKRYPSKAAMGTLTLDVLECQPFWGIERSMVGDAKPSRVHSVSVVGRWHLSYPEDAEREDAEGLTLLVFKRQGESWLIVHDASM